MESNKTTIVLKFIKCIIIALDKCTVIVLYYMRFLSFFIWIIVKRKGDSLSIVKENTLQLKSQYFWNTFLDLQLPLLLLISN